MQILMVGYGAMAKAVMQALPKEIAIRWLVVREGKVQAVQHEVGSSIQVVSKIDDIQGTPDAVIEVAGQSALQMHLPKAIAFGVPIGIISVGHLRMINGINRWWYLRENMAAVCIFYLGRLQVLMH
ncbi:L-aspartate dehydrogenase [Wohlfahrtiimonas chitiniclastica]|nr:hypothetical protein [Wohlfahrtiimonas chitiniclastica]KZS23093.1 L-aspartate dehydrogenase [Wohlfahrtiimonas chitiniclastica]